MQSYGSAKCDRKLVKKTMATQKFKLLKENLLFKSNNVAKVHKYEDS
jgi:hypothetical protein